MFLNRLSMRAIALTLTLVSYGCGSESGDGASTTGGIAPPAWIQGSWVGGSPIVLHLKFTKDSILDEDGKNALPNYTEVGKSDTEYLLERGGESSLFVMVSSSKLNWHIDNGTISTTVGMKKQ